MPTFLNLPQHTARLHLRPLVHTDAEALFSMFSDVEVMRYWSTLPWTSMGQSHAFIERDHKGFEAGEFLRLGIVTQVDNAVVGQCTLFSINPACRRAELGYSLVRQAWGKGYANEALRALIRYGFEQLNLNRIEADIDPRNTNSAKALTRLGFTREGCLRERWIVGDEVSDSEMYGLLRREWALEAT